MKIQISPETELVMDPLTSVISKQKPTAQHRSMIALIKKLDEAERAVDGLVDALAPDKPLLNSWRGREKTSFGAGFITNIFYGMIAGLIVAGIFLIAIYLAGGV
ncbi:tetrahydromethanopterin S-methyltransferase subunit MtrB [Methanolapillus ohkumae]|uniref:Tetrahydromethanopterin S-methyltransferase subunit B n=1 Tax=Methanolapillus ohkumae TaxID=3028298 RepID=A0AA96V7S1_9EURY|nr:hypothetical protein MsAm2_15390 [Methanosarcinaceae archaeon Am2]